MCGSPWEYRTSYGAGLRPSPVRAGGLQRAWRELAVGDPAWRGAAGSRVQPVGWRARCGGRGVGAELGGGSSRVEVGKGSSSEGRTLGLRLSHPAVPLVRPRVHGLVRSAWRKSSASRCLSREQGRALGTKRYSWWLKAGGWSPHASVGVSWLQSDRGHLQGQTAMLVCVRAPWPARGRGPAVADHPEET